MLGEMHKYLIKLRACEGVLVRRIARYSIELSSCKENVWRNARYLDMS